MKELMRKIWISKFTRFGVGLFVGILLRFGLNWIFSESVKCVPISLYGKLCGEIDINCCQSPSDVIRFYVTTVSSLIILISCPVLFVFLGGRRSQKASDRIKL